MDMIESPKRESIGTVLFIDDDKDLSEMVAMFFRDKGYDIDLAFDGVTGLHHATHRHYDVIVTDIMLPGMSGLDLCASLRSRLQEAVPVLMLSGCNTVEEKIRGLESGADDYLTKPVELRELEARLRGLIRRERRQLLSKIYTVGDLTLDMATFQASRAGKRLIIPPMEVRLLEILMRESPRIVSRREIERELWKDQPLTADNLRSHLYTLRQIIDKPFEQPLLHTVHAAGYRIAAAA